MNKADLYTILYFSFISIAFLLVRKMISDLKKIMHRQMDALKNAVASLQNETNSIMQRHTANLSSILNKIPTDFGDFRNRSQVISRIELLKGKRLRGDSENIYSFEFIKKSMLESYKVISNRSDILVCNIAIGDEYRKAIRHCIESHERYAATHGYACVSVEHKPLGLERPLPWLKIPLISKLLDQGKQNLVYIDADAMITNYRMEIEKCFELMKSKNVSLYLTNDELGLNSGVFFVRNTAEAKTLLELIWLYDLDINNGTWEQFALKSLVDEYECINRHILVECDPKKFNSFPIERNIFFPTSARQVWSRNDFICHFSGIRQPHLQSFVERYERALNG